MAALKGKPLNGVEEFDPMERPIAAIDLLGKLDRLFIKEWKVEPALKEYGPRVKRVEKLEAPFGVIRLLRRTPIYFENNKEMFESLFEKHKASNPSLSVGYFQKALKSEIDVLLKAIKQYYHGEGQSEAPTSEWDERIVRANEFLEWLGKYDPKLKREKRQTFESLFKDKEDAKRVKAFFESRGYTINGKWVGISNDKMELLAAYHALKNRSYLKPGKVQPQATIFYKEFDLEVATRSTQGAYIVRRTLNNTPNADLIMEFDHML